MVYPTNLEMRPIKHEVCIFTETMAVFLLPIGGFYSLVLRYLLDVDFTICALALRSAEPNGFIFKDLCLISVPFDLSTRSVLVPRVRPDDNPRTGSVTI